MEASELLEIISRGEDGRHQFKAFITNGSSLAAEIAAFSNSGGGMILVGVGDDGTIAGLTLEQVRELNQLIPNVASNQVKPPVNVVTENLGFPEGLVLSITVQDGIGKPYFDNSGAVWVKSGSDKRKVTSREEIQRMFQSAGLIHGDEIPANGLTVADVDMDYFRGFYRTAFGEDMEQAGVGFPKLLENMNLARSGVLNIAGALLFAGNPSFRLPVFIVKAVAFPGNAIEEERFLDSKDITGRIADVFQKTIGFIISNLKAIQGAKGVNAVGDPEIPRVTLEELVANSLIHRDYFISAPNRVLVFKDRVEILSPGNLPNNLSVENILNGNSNIRNPILASFATRILPYRGLESGIKRALKAFRGIEFIDDRDQSLFKVILRRRS